METSGYTFAPYDVLQVRWPSVGEWQDFVTLRSEDTALQAMAICDTGRWNGMAGDFRIVRNSPPPCGRVVYQGGQQL